jgi:hypothetical protein
MHLDAVGLDEFVLKLDHSTRLFLRGWRKVVPFGGLLQRGTFIIATASAKNSCS